MQMFPDGKGGTMAATRLIPLHQNKGRTIAQCLADRTAYSKNPEKTDGGELISSYGCDPKTVDEEFMLSKRQYEYKTGKKQEKNVIAYQIRQSFKPGEITPEEANRIGYELAMRFTKGKHAFIVATHNDRAHIHNHVIFNSTTMDGSRKFRDFFFSGIALQRVSDLICLENGLSTIPWTPYRDRNSKNPFGKKKDRLKPERSFGYLIDIEKKIAEGKSSAYIGWAKRFNLKQAAKAVLFLKEHQIGSMEDLEKTVSDCSVRYEELKNAVKASEEKLTELAQLKTHIINFMKTKDVYSEFKRRGFSGSYFEEHREALLLNRAAKKAFDELELKKLPKVSELNQEYDRILKQKKEAYAELRNLRNEFHEYQTAQEIAKTILSENEKKERQTKVKTR